MKRLFNIVILLVCIGCNSQPKDIIIYKKGEVIPDVAVKDKQLMASADYLVSVFGKTYGEKLTVLREPGNKPSIQLELLKKSKEAGYFKITAGTGYVKIEGTTPEEVNKGMVYLFTHYGSASCISGKGIMSAENKIIAVPHDLSYTQTCAFEYREPYFPDNYDVEFRKWYNTHTMEDTWAMWGHNLSKVVTPSAQMMAKVNGKVNEEQFCFSSPGLEAALIAYIERMNIDEPLRSKFMVQPNDNDIVCLCDKCKAAGNTSKDASPAVFGLLNKLAMKFPKQEFFSSAYITTMHPPKFKLADNAGVMVSTMAFPKGVAIEHSGKKAMVDKTFADWKKVTNTIYLWDYAVNFDNYFEAYPTLLVAQANLHYYKTKGVKGVFIHGSEDKYSAYGDLKNYIYALLLNDLDSNVKKETHSFFKAKYPAVADLLSDYYLKIEQRSFEKKVQLDIYGGIEQSRKKYLDEAEFNLFYEALIRKSESLTANELKDIKPLLLSLTFIKLEILRTNGVAENGYKPTPDASINKEVDILFRRLYELSQQTGIKTYSETGLLIQDYLEQWNAEIVKKQYCNLLFGKKVKLAFTPDEEYNNAMTLTDGAIGFSDYYNNWMICSQEALVVDIAASDVQGAKSVEIDFLQDIKHNIYPPQKVEVIVDGKVYTANPEVNEDTKVFKRHIRIPVDINSSSKTIQVKTIKAAEFKNKSMACDEIFFKK